MICRSSQGSDQHAGKISCFDVVVEVNYTTDERPAWSLAPARWYSRISSYLSRPRPSNPQSLASPVLVSNHTETASATRLWCCQQSRCLQTAYATFKTSLCATSEARHQVVTRMNWLLITSLQYLPHSLRLKIESMP